jgi:nicotinamidase-related amidase
METLDPRRSALVIVDLQQGITAGSYAPHGVAEIIARSNRLARRFRAVRTAEQYSATLAAG